MGFIPGHFNVGPDRAGAGCRDNPLLLTITGQRPAISLFSQKIFYRSKEITRMVVHLEEQVGSPVDGLMKCCQVGRL